MATLQNIRSKGPLLVIVIGLALFAFIAGDAWKVLQPHQSQDVGEIDGETISAQEYQALVEEYTEVVVPNKEIAENSYNLSVSNYGEKEDTRHRRRRDEKKDVRQNLLGFGGSPIVAAVFQALEASLAVLSLRILIIRF